MASLNNLFENNRAWASSMEETHPGFFSKLAGQQSPKYLWIGCSDSRVPANEIVGLLPGELFVHRNVANLVVHSDLNCLSVIQYAVEALQVEHIIVCGHYGCGGIHAALTNRKLGLIDNWLRSVQDVMNRHTTTLGAIHNEHDRVNRLCELNVVEQVINVCRTTIVQEAWQWGRKLSVHGWVYDIADGLLRDLGIEVDGMEALTRVDAMMTAS